jgi:hypothetical protein
MEDKLVLLRSTTSFDGPMGIPKWLRRLSTYVLLNKRSIVLEIQSRDEGRRLGKTSAGRLDISEVFALNNRDEVGISRTSSEMQIEWSTPDEVTSKIAAVQRRLTERSSIY